MNISRPEYRGQFAYSPRQRCWLFWTVFVLALAAAVYCAIQLGGMR